MRRLFFDDGEVPVAVPAPPPVAHAEPAAKGPVRVSHSELACFRRCPREWHHRYIKKRESRSVATALQVGRRVDTAIKDIHRGVPPDLDLLEPAERAIVQGYAIRWKKSELEVEEVDVAFDVVIGGARMVGELDAVGTQHNRKVIVELKTTSKDISPGSAYWRRITHLDPQATIYLHVAKSQGWQIGFIVWDVIRKTLLRKKANETDDAFEVRILEDIAERPDFYFARQTVVRYDAEHQAHARDIDGYLHLMHAVRQMPEAPRNVDSCMKFGRSCDFMEVCTSEVSIDDNTRFTDKSKRSSETAAAAPVRQVAAGRNGARG